MSTNTLEREALADADQRAARQAVKRRELEARFLEIAADKPWFVGTGNDDAIFPHQWTAMCFGAVAKRVFIGDKMGLGKTREAIGWLDLVDAKRVILIAERNIAPQFAGEIEEMAPHRHVIQLAGLSKKTRQERLAKASRMDEAILVINYEMFRQDQDSLVKVLAWQADTVVVDESHNMKSLKSSNFKTVQRILFTDNTCEQCGALITGLSKPCKACDHTQSLAGQSAKDQRSSLSHYLSTKSVQNVALMSGTPLLNSPEDLYSSFHLIDPVKFPTVEQFKRTFLKPSYAEGTRKMVFKRDGLEMLKPFIKNFYIARDLEDVGTRGERDGVTGIELPGGRFLPDQQEHIVSVDLDPEKYPLQLRTIKQVSEQARITLSTGEKHTLMHMISIILRKRQANVWPGGIEIRDQESGKTIFSVGKEVQESAKMDACQEQIEAYLAEGRRQVVFSQFRTALEEFERRLVKAGIRVVRLDGSTPEKLRNEIKTNFYRAKGETPKWDVVLVHYKTGGAGLNLTSATVTHMLDEEWNDGKKQQAKGRTHRIGQEEPSIVLIYRIPKTVDTFMANLISMKKRMADSLKRTMTNEELIRKVGDAILNGEML